MSTRYALMLAASLGRSATLPYETDEDCCLDAAELADAFVQRLTADGNSLRDTLNAYDDLRGGVLLYDAADLLWDIARREWHTGRLDAVAIADEAFAVLFPHAVR